MTLIFLAIQVFRVDVAHYLIVDEVKKLFLFEV